MFSMAYESLTNLAYSTVYSKSLDNVISMSWLLLEENNSYFEKMFSNELLCIYRWIDK